MQIDNETLDNQIAYSGCDVAGAAFERHLGFRSSMGSVSGISTGNTFYFSCLLFLAHFLVLHGVHYYHPDIPAMAFVLYTAILFERSYRLKGAVLGIIYAASAVIIFLLPEIITTILGRDYLYPIELLIVHAVLWAMITALSLWVSNYLINKKVTV